MVFDYTVPPNQQCSGNTIQIYSPKTVGSFECHPTTLTLPVTMDLAPVQIKGYADLRNITLVAKFQYGYFQDSFNVTLLRFPNETQISVFDIQLDRNTYQPGIILAGVNLQATYLELRFNVTHPGPVTPYPAYIPNTPMPNSPNTPPFPAMAVIGPIIGVLTLAAIIWFLVWWRRRQIDGPRPNETNPLLSNQASLKSIYADTVVVLPSSPSSESISGPSSSIDRFEVSSRPVVADDSLLSLLQREKVTIIRQEDLTTIKIIGEGGSGVVSLQLWKPQNLNVAVKSVRGFSPNAQFVRSHTV